MTRVYFVRHAQPEHECFDFWRLERSHHVKVFIL